MNLRYSALKKDLKSLIRHAVSEAKPEGKELVGLIIDNGTYLEFVTCKNKSRRPASFSFYYREVRSIVAAARILGHEAVGTFHSHPAGLAQPGDSDIENAVDDSLMLIIDCLDREVALWRIKGGKAHRAALHQIDSPEISKSRARSSPT